MKSIIDVATEAANFKILLSALNSAALDRHAARAGSVHGIRSHRCGAARLPAGALDAMFKDKGTLRAVPVQSHHGGRDRGE